MATLCVSLYLVQSGYQNTYSISKMRTFSHIRTMVCVYCCGFSSGSNLNELIKARLQDET